jgi:hypothetical protein
VGLAKVVGIRGIFDVGVKWLLGAGLILALAGNVSANIVVEPRLEDPVSGILTLIAVNFSTDLFLITAAVYAAFALKKRGLGDVSNDPGVFVGMVVLAAALVAVAGGVIDFAFLYEKVEDHYLLRNFSVGIVLAAAALIFVTIAAFLRAIVGIRSTISLAAAAVIAPMSPFGWWAMSLLVHSPFPGVGAVVILVASSLAFVILFGLHRLHVRVFSGAFDKAYEGGEP